jgi:hypothetical protein
MARIFCAANPCFYHDRGNRRRALSNPAARSDETDQKKLLEALLAGPRGGGNNSSEATQKILRGGPVNAWMRSPDLGNRLNGDNRSVPTLRPLLCGAELNKSRQKIKARRASTLRA